MPAQDDSAREPVRLHAEHWVAESPFIGEAAEEQAPIDPWYEGYTPFVEGRELEEMHGPEAEKEDHITEDGETPFIIETKEALESPALTLRYPEAEHYEPPVAEWSSGPTAEEAEDFTSADYEEDELELLREQPLVERFDPSAVPKDVADALGKKDWPLALKLAIQAGWRDENELTNLIFFTRHPELPPEPLDSKGPKFKQLSAGWTKILIEIVWKAIEASVENTDLVVSGEEVARYHRRFFRGKSGKRLKKLIEDAAREVDLNPGLLGTIMMAETRRPQSYFSSGKVRSYHVGTDDFYENRAAIKARVPAYANVKWDKNQTPDVHLNDATKPRLVKTILFDSGPDAVLATAVDAKFREVRLREIAAGLKGDFDNLPLATRFALTRMAFAGGTAGATPFLKDALKGVDIFIRKAIPVRARQTKRNATVRTAQAMHLSDWIFGIPVPAAAAQPELETLEEEPREALREATGEAPELHQDRPAKEYTSPVDIQANRFDLEDREQQIETAELKRFYEDRYLATGIFEQEYLEQENAESFAEEGEGRSVEPEGERLDEASEPHQEWLAGEDEYTPTHSTEAESHLRQAYFDSFVGEAKALLDTAAEEVRRYDLADMSEMEIEAIVDQHQTAETLFSQVYEHSLNNVRDAAKGVLNELQSPTKFLQAQVAQRMPISVDFREHPVLELDGFSEYMANITPEQIKAIDDLAVQIVKSQDTNNPIFEFRVEGFADVARRIKKPDERKALEDTISKERALNAFDLLVEALKRKGGDALAQKIKQGSRAFGLGSQRLKVPKATTEAQFRRNRRVVFIVRQVTFIPRPPPPSVVGMEHMAPPAPKKIPGMPAAAPSAVFEVGMEHIAPPASQEITGMPAAAQPEEQATLSVVLPPLSSVGATWRNSCAGGDRFANNCAHFLSDAFIRAGYTELRRFGAHCSPANRPIRAREMWHWFDTKAVRRSNTVRRNTGWWAVFQLDERAYWGGHVAVLDSDAWRYYGTGWYANWNQYLYQW
jgi:hypothetical protein